MKLPVKRETHMIQIESNPVKTLFGMINHDYLLIVGEFSLRSFNFNLVWILIEGSHLVF